MSPVPALYYGLKANNAEFNPESGYRIIGDRRCEVKEIRGICASQRRGAGYVEMKNNFNYRNIKQACHYDVNASRNLGCIGT